MKLVKCKPGYGQHFYRRDNICAYCKHNKNDDPRFEGEKEATRIEKLKQISKNNVWRRQGTAKLHE